jgi:hypothetical protein
MKKYLLAWIVATAAFVLTVDARADDLTELRRLGATLDEPRGLFERTPSVVVLPDEPPELRRVRLERLKRLEKRRDQRLGLIFIGIPIAALGFAGAGALEYDALHCRKRCNVNLSWDLPLGAIAFAFGGGGTVLVAVGATRPADPDIARPPPPVVSVGPGSVHVSVAF